MEEPPLVVILPSPGMGHIIPFVEFARQLVFCHRLPVTFMIPTIGPEHSAQKSLLEGLSEETNNMVNTIYLPEINFQDLPQGVQIEMKISLAITRSISFIRDAFSTLLFGDNNEKKNRFVYLLVDFFGSDALDVAEEFNVKPYLFVSTTSSAVSFMLEFPKWAEQISIPDPVQLPGSISLSRSDFPDPMRDTEANAYKMVLGHCKRFCSAIGIIVNSFLELEPQVINYLNDIAQDCPLVYPIGPLVQRGPNHDDEPKGSGCIEWLNDQPEGSVLMVAFGSGGTLSSDQIQELALGLEMSKKRFIWVVRSPNDKVANGAYMDVQSGHKDPLKSLPPGFLDRTRELGLVVPNWAPQAQILSHGSTGGFVTHCGWNSILESIVHGVPLIAWPLYAEQRMNAVVLEEGFKVALRPKVNETGLVMKEEIARVVNDLFDGVEGKRIGDRMKKLKNAAISALSEDGSSTKSLQNLVRKWRNPNGT